MYSSNYAYEGEHLQTKLKRIRNEIDKKVANQQMRRLDGVREKG